MKPLSTLPPRKRLRTAFALLISAIAAALICSVVLRLFAEQSQILELWLGFCVIFLAVNASIGLAFQALAFRGRWLRARTYLIAGTGLGAAFGVIYFNNHLNSTFAQDAPLAETLGVFIGIMLSTALPGALLLGLFWAVRRPDRDEIVKIDAVFE